MATRSAIETPCDLIMAEGFDGELDRLKAFLAAWVEGSSREMRPLLDWQFLGRSKYFRPLTVFACHAAVCTDAIDEDKIRAAAAIEMVHNVTLIVDDILDRSRFRRDLLTLHCRFGLLPALMAAGYIAADAYELLNHHPFAGRQVSGLFRRLAVAETLQWRLRRQPLGIEDWRILANEDTGSMFEACACLGTGDETLRTYGGLLGALYHACDDVADVKGATALGGGGEEDIRDGILTLPAAIAIREAETALLFRNPTPGAQKALLKKLQAALPAAERYLDALAAQAEAEAHRAACAPEVLIKLVRNTRQLSS
ncbi:MAG: polyprenyl synthetase family protein [Gammaproteobacteria bacterium]|nr:polyprenyl synthetase family protein [Gammaproteobacteria bacterium]